MRIAVYGAGGVGGYLGGRLAQAGEEVAIIARGEHLSAIQTHGLKVESVAGDFVVQPALATETPEEAGVGDAVILGVVYEIRNGKLVHLRDYWDTATVLRQLGATVLPSQ